MQNGVDIWRPLLGMDKKDILDFAHKFGVPYFKDSTPSWSCRGKLRSSLIPLLQVFSSSLLLSSIELGDTQSL